MSSRVPLRIDSAFGASLGSTLLLSSHPEESHDDNGDPRPDARTLVLALRGNRASFVNELQTPALRSWYSTGSQTAYCGSVDSNAIHLYHGGRWTRQSFSDKPVDYIRYVYGWAGTTPESDTVMLATQDSLFVRLGGAWKQYQVPGEGFPLQMVGTSPQQIYVGGPELCLWDGTTLTALEGPPWDNTDCLAITPDDRLVAGSEYVSVSRPDGGWEKLDTPMRGFAAFARYKDTIYALSHEDGVASVYPGPVTAVTRALEATTLVSVGDGLVAIGDDGVLVFDGSQWSEIEIPLCEVGKLPT